MGVFDRSTTDLRQYMDRLHNDATGLRNQISVDTLPGGAGRLEAGWVSRWFLWYADWSRYYWANRPTDQTGLWPADDAVWSQVAGYEHAFMNWRGQYEQQSGRKAQPHSPPIPPQPSPDNGLNIGLDGAGVALGIGTVLGIGAVAAVLVLSRR